MMASSKFEIFVRQCPYQPIPTHFYFISPIVVDAVGT